MRLERRCFLFLPALAAACAWFVRRDDLHALCPRGVQPGRGPNGEAAIGRSYPGYGFGVFLALGIPAAWRQQAARAVAGP